MIIMIYIIDLIEFDGSVVSISQHKGNVHNYIKRRIYKDAYKI